MSAGGCGDGTWELAVGVQCMGEGTAGAGRMSRYEVAEGLRSVLNQLLHRMMAVSLSVLTLVALTASFSSCLLYHI